MAPAQRALLLNGLPILRFVLLQYISEMSPPPPQALCAAESHLSFNQWLKLKFWSSHRGAVETHPTRKHEVVGLIPGLVQ